MTVYMDYHATTPVDPRVLQAMLPYFSERFGNPGSINHALGRQAQEAVDDARRQIAEAIGAQPREIVFTSGATESNNLALRGAAERHAQRKRHLVSVVTEHRAVLDPLQRLARRGWELTLLQVAPADRPDAGRLDPQQVADALRPDTLLVSVMLANNEIGVLQPVAEIGRLCRAAGVLLHCDATQAVGKVPVDVQQLHVDLMSFSAHKLYGPKGVGALYVRRGVRLQPLLDGGGQEHGLRSGTLNAAGIVGFACAVALAVQEMPDESSRLRDLRDRLYAGLCRELDGVLLNGPVLQPGDLRLPGNLNCSFEGVDGEALMTQLTDLAVSSGSACTSANPEPSHVVRALGRSAALTRASLRFGLGRFTTAADVEFAAGYVAETVRALRRGERGRHVAGTGKAASP
jgi:cysteine desulfurase